MKYLFFGLILIFTPRLQSQSGTDYCWQWHNPLPQGNTLNDVFFIIETTGWAVGEAGIIIKTSNGGANWKQQISGTSERLWSVYFTDNQTGWAVGNKGKILNIQWRGELAVANACGEITTYEQTISITSGVSDPEFLKEFRLYPNPAGDFFTLSLKDDPRKAVVVDVFSSTGQKLISENLDFQLGTASKHYSCRDWPAGAYWVRVLDTKGGV